MDWNSIRRTIEEMKQASFVIYTIESLIDRSMLQ